MKLIDDCLAGFKNRLLQLQAENAVEGDADIAGELEETLADFSLVSGASEADLVRLKAAYPDCPEVLTELLRRVDGAYWRECQGKEITLYLLGSDVGAWQYPCCLLSALQILESAEENRGESIRETYAEHLEDIEIDPRIAPDLTTGKRLHFSDCMNNGGASQLFIDFNSRGKGKAGQIIRFLHDPDGYAVVADGFEDCLRLPMAHGYNFIRFY
ncbi:MAG: SMI1/KNR4 family protein [Zoogloeaceae bacterium]|jgi:hypothetical protein|nr:SMI1/KNR4 family protein [Zoogloeaceae bacterium]